MGIKGIIPSAGHDAAANHLGDRIYGPGGDGGIVRKGSGLGGEGFAQSRRQPSQHGGRLLPVNDAAG